MTDVEHSCYVMLLNASYAQVLVKAISQVRFENGKCPSVVRKFLTDQLKYNDNTANPVSSFFELLVTGIAEEIAVHRRILHLYPHLLTRLRLYLHLSS